MKTIPQPRQKISSKIIIVWRLSSFLKNVFALIFLLVFLYVNSHFNLDRWIVYFLYLGIGFILLRSVYRLTIHPLYLQRSWRYEIGENYLQIKYGFLYEHYIIVPLSRIKDMKTNQGPLLRKFGLVTITIKTTASTYMIPGLSVDDVKEIENKMKTFMLENLAFSKPDNECLSSTYGVRKDLSFLSQQANKRKHIQKEEPHSNELKTGMLFPFIHTKKIKQLLIKIGSHYQIHEEMNALPQRAMFINLIQPSYSLIIVTFLVFFFWPEYWVIPVLLFLYILLFRVVQTYQTKYLLTNQSIQVLTGGFSPSLVWTNLNNVDGLEISQSQIQKTLGLVSIHISISAKPVDILHLKNIPIEAATTFISAYLID